MRILLDECVDQRLRLSFVGHDCQTAGHAKLAGLENGALLDAAEAADFDVLERFRLVRSGVENARAVSTA